MLMHVDDVDWRKPKDLRGGHILFKDIFLGEEGTLDNLHLSLVQTGDDYYTPRHRHNFDQFRVVLDGQLFYGRDWVLPAGSVTYFGEGTPYGPTEGRGQATWLLLQFGSASLSGYLSQRELFAAMESLGRSGRFSQGVYTRVLPDGRKQNQDAYEAAWQEHRGQPLVYPAARYPAPLVCVPRAFAWAEAEDGVRSKRLLQVTERRIAADVLALAPGAAVRLGEPEQATVAYALSGRGSSAPGAWRAGSALWLRRGDSIRLEAAEAAEWLVFTLPRFTDDELARVPHDLKVAA